MTVTPATTTMMVIAVAKDAIYLRLPRELQRDCGGCSCEICKKNPELAKWDTLVVPRKLHDHSWTVHMPDARVASFNEYLRQKERPPAQRGEGRSE